MARILSCTLYMQTHTYTHMAVSLTQNLVCVTTSLIYTHKHTKMFVFGLNISLTELCTNATHKQGLYCIFNAHLRNSHYSLVHCIKKTDKKGIHLMKFVCC